MPVRLLPCNTWDPPEVDAAPAAAMRRELAVARAAGLRFDSVWQFAVLRVTRELIGPERREWIDIFGEQRAVWCAAFEGREVPDIRSLVPPPE